jgi:hypothetical protein
LLLGGAGGAIASGFFAIGTPRFSSSWQTDHGCTIIHANRAQRAGEAMPDSDAGRRRTRLTRRNADRRAASNVVKSTGDRPSGNESQQAQAGRLGGLKGGPARAKRLSAKRRSEIARKAAHARWGQT